ncbi:MAG: flavodoxin family protein [Chloroflexi bacterium]|nr:flavodoxin family protein [Chloroflexota bacterium]
MQIEVLGISGSPVEGGNTEAFLREGLKAAEAEGSVKTKLISLAGKDIRDCRHCNWCLRKQEENKFCAQQDEMQEIYEAIVEADAVLFASPAYIGRLSGYMACTIDRLRAFVYGNQYGGKLKDKVGGALAVAWGRNSGLETTLLSLVSAMFILGMVPVIPLESPGSPFGAAGVSSEGGTGRFNRDDKLLVLKDEYGLAGARGLGKRLVEVTRLLKAGGDVLSARIR